MLCFDIRALDVQAATVDDFLSPTDPVWREGDPVPAGPVHITGRLSAAGAGRFYWHGRIEGEVTMPCRRCLEDTTAPVADDVYLIFVESADEEADNPDVYTLESGALELDLRPAIREHWLLDVPTFVLCREDCKGLCPTCGAELNQGSCGCPPVADAHAVHDARWNALHKLDSGSSE
ncbi:MAG TPA: DUF177 domain-containing protein [Gemmatimonadaceae bacterium]|jgi:uncharacterized protein